MRFFQISGVVSTKLPLLAIRSQYRANRRIRCIVAKSIVLRLQHLVRRVRAVDHAPLGVVPHDRRAAQPLEHADLDLLRPQRDQPVEPAAKLSRSSPGRPTIRSAWTCTPVSLAQEPQVVRELRVVLPAADALRHVVVERLDADLELQRARRELRDRLAQRLGQPVRDHLEVQEQPRRDSARGRTRGSPG